MEMCILLYISQIIYIFLIHNLSKNATSLQHSKLAVSRADLLLKIPTCKLLKRLMEGNLLLELHSHLIIS